MAVRIDDRQYARRKEKKQKHGWNFTPTRANHRPNQGRSRSEPIAYAHTTNPGRMDLDAIQKRRFTGKCYNCDKSGHLAKDCRQPRREKNNSWKPAPEPTKTNQLDEQGYNEGTQQRKERQSRMRTQQMVPLLQPKLSYTQDSIERTQLETRNDGTKRPEQKPEPSRRSLQTAHVLYWSQGKPYDRAIQRNPRSTTRIRGDSQRAPATRQVATTATTKKPLRTTGHPWKGPTPQQDFTTGITTNTTTRYTRKSNPRLDETSSCEECSRN